MQKLKKALATGKNLHHYVPNDISASINDANILIRDAVELVKLDSHPEFSSDLRDQTASVCYTSLVADRLINKFSFGESLVDTKAVAFDKYVKFEIEHCKPLSEAYEYWGPTKAHLTIRQASASLSKWFRNFEFDLRESMVEFTPGETFTSTRGDVSVASKLSDQKHWTTSWNCLDLTCKLIYNNAGLKKAAREHIGVVDRESKRRLYSRFRKSANVGFEVFSWLLKDRVLTVVDGARASSVPKNITTDRFINIEPMFSMMLQRIIASTFRKVLKRIGNNLSNQVPDNLSAQDLHKLLIKFPEFATIDFSNASDSVLLSVVVQIFPRSVSDVLVKTRSQFIDFGDHVVQPYKLSSMGNGFTFEVMTMLLYAISSTLTPFCRVYGDDVIIPNEKSPAFIDACSLIGFNVNMKKSFINSQFRESCGAFYHDDVGYLTSFDFRVNTSMSDVITTANKLYVILNNDLSYLLSEQLVSVLGKLHTDLMLLIPVLQKGYVPLTSTMKLENLSLYAFDPVCFKKHKKNATVRALRGAAIDTVDSSDLLRELETAVITLVPRWKPMRKKGVKKVFSTLSNLYAMRVTAPTMKGKGKWVLIPCFITETGSVLQITECENTLASTFSSRRVVFDHRATPEV